MGRSNLNDQVRSTFCVLRRRLFSLPSPRTSNHEGGRVDAE